MSRSSGGNHNSKRVATCGTCHSGDVKYYADEGEQGLIEKLGQAVDTSSANPKMAMELMQRIGMAGCFKCHVVHVSGAFAKAKDHSGDKH